MTTTDTHSPFWQSKKVFITGHTGFKGSWLFRILETLGAEPFGYALPPPELSLYSSLYGVRPANGVYADIRDRERLEIALSTFAPDIVFHLAAQPLVRESYRQPVYTYETNVMGTVNLLEAVRAYNRVKAVVVITTDKCYRDMDWEWGYRESDLLGGADPYSSSKACVELLCDAWRLSYFDKSDVALATARAGNVIGGGDWADDRIVPDAMRSFQSGSPLCIRSPQAVRPWQHVLDPLHGYLMLAERLYSECANDFPRAWNFGPPSSDFKNVEELSKKLCELWGSGARYIASESSLLRESNMLCLDSSRAIQKLGWNPRWDFSGAVSMTVDWYKCVFDGERALSVTDRQIEMYVKEAAVRTK